MKYHAPTVQFKVEASKLKHASACFLYAIKYIRESAGLPLTRYERTGALSDADHAQRALIDGAECLGVDLGARWGNEIDVSSIE
jgi:hypothetical protein